MGRHSRKGPERAGPDTEAARLAETVEERDGVRPAPGSGRRRRPDGATAGAQGHASFQQTGHVRGGHPEQREPGGGWGAGPVSAGPGDGRAPAQRHSASRSRTERQAPSEEPASSTGAVRSAGRSARSGEGRPVIPGPRREYVEAFDRPAGQAAPVARTARATSTASAAPPAQAPAHAPSASPAPPPPRAPRGPGSPATAAPDPDGPGGGRGDGERATGDPGSSGGGKATIGRAFTGIAAAAVTTVLAIVVAGQVARDEGGANSAARSTGVDRDDTRDASRSDDRPTPEAARAKPLSYEQKMAKAYPLAAELHGSGKFETVPGAAKAPGRGHKYRYRIDVEQGLGLDVELFARAVQETLNDDRSWAHGGAMTFERISSGDPDFVVTLASPGTTGDWCRKSGLDTTEDNVSCDSAATERVMINAYRWAQGSSTFGPDKLFAYRQMLINHEVGHRLGHNHVSCGTPGALAPVMQQQTKSLNVDGIKCRPNAWVHPKG
ncbi:DUF3152 domain-containing protein [Streptomyces sp. PTD5-9]|uniref:DUF3152 domain-containing protein n=1 Tax=Streptomyces sp. PTD5-9 TaxID=3120150 RepID=UPI003009244F